MSAGLSAAAIASAWPGDAPLPCIEVVDCIDSTQDALRARGAAASGCLLLARQQSAGRGQRQRRWLSPPDAGLYLSLGWNLQRPATQLGGLSLALGVAVAATLRDLGFPRVAVKWPNDLVVGEAKLGGLLVELGDAAEGCAVVGLGLNLRLPEGSGETLGRPVVDLATLGELPEANALIARLAGALIATLIDVDQHGFGEWHRRWPDFDALYGQRLQIDRGSAAPLCGEAAGIDTQGALLLRQNDSLLAVHSGEANLLRAGT
jgi:BirA family biotin operon repressor/biotin-[acetyl-CoA-carboxylase] ligase